MFWDSSAVLPTVVAEARSAEMIQLLRADLAPVIWWATPVECHSAVARRHRDGHLAAAPLAKAIARLDAWLVEVDSVTPTERVRERARRLLDLHPLRPADSLQLAAALVWAEAGKPGEAFVCLDGRLREAAQREGFVVLPN